MVASKCRVVTDTGGVHERVVEVEGDRKAILGPPVEGGAHEVSPELTRPRELAPGSGEDDGTSFDDGQIRLRPILMTTFAAGGGMIPIAIGHGVGGEARSPMGVAVIGGLLMSTVLTLVVVPCLFSVVASISWGAIRTSRLDAIPSAGMLNSARMIPKCANLS